MPVSGATTANVATRTTATRLAIVIDSMSETAANSMQNGKITKMAASSIAVASRTDRNLRHHTDGALRKGEPVAGNCRYRKAALCGAAFLQISYARDGRNQLTVSFIVSAMLWNWSSMALPSEPAPTMLARAMRAAIRPYSIAVAPDSSFTKRAT